MATDDGTKTWKGVTWRRGERLRGARGKNKGVMAAVRENKHERARVIAMECAERDRLRAEYVAESAAHECPTCGSVMQSIRLQLAVSFGDAGQVNKTTQCADTFHGKKPKRKKRHKFVPPNGGELIEKVL